MRSIAETGAIAPVTIHECHVVAWTDVKGAVLLNGSHELMLDGWFVRPPSGPRWP
jgi:hypothetical protein